jgi:two-component system, cell cycle sensor histidine kinase and response regulator CckA
MKPDSESGLRGSETILLVEDDRAVRMVTRAMLEPLGYTVLEAANAQSALNQLPDDRVALMLTDVIMPGMNGRDLAERATAIQPGMKVIFLSGYTDETIKRHGVLHPAMNYLGKPFSPEALAGKVRSVLDQR